MIKSRRLRWADHHVARMGKSRSAFKILTGTPRGNIPPGRPKHRWEDNIRMDLEEIGINTRHWVDSAQDTDLLEIPCESGIQSLGFISHGVS